MEVDMESLNATTTDTKNLDARDRSVPSRTASSASESDSKNSHQTDSSAQTDLDAQPESKSITSSVGRVKSVRFADEIIDLDDQVKTESNKKQEVPESNLLYEIDFDLEFRKHRKISLSKRLKKRVSFVKDPVVMPPSTPEPESPTISESNTRSLSDRFTSFFTSTTSRLSTPTKIKESTPVEEEPRDPLPETKELLEQRLNWHLAALDRLRRKLRIQNDAIRDQISHRNETAVREGQHMPATMRQLDDLIVYHRQVRDELGSFVVYHRDELKRIAQKRIQLDTEMGLEPFIPEALKRGITNDEEWRQYFSV